MIKSITNFLIIFFIFAIKLTKMDNNAFSLWANWLVTYLLLGNSGGNVTLIRIAVTLFRTAVTVFTLKHCDSAYNCCDWHTVTQYCSNTETLWHCLELLWQCLELLWHWHTVTLFLVTNWHWHTVTLFRTAVTLKHCGTAYNCCDIDTLWHCLELQ